MAYPDGTACSGTVFCPDDCPFGNVISNSFNLTYASTHTHLHAQSVYMNAPCTHLWTRPQVGVVCFRCNTTSARLQDWLQRRFLVLGADSVVTGREIRIPRHLIRPRRLTKPRKSKAR